MVVPLRHSLVWLDVQGWCEVVSQVPLQHRAAITQWREADFPLTVRRRDADCPNDQLCLGIALPPLEGIKTRLPFRIDHRTVHRYQDPLSMAEVLSALPPRWRDAAMRLDLAAQRVGLLLQVFGSAALESITGMRYLHTASDLDILLTPTNIQQLDACVRLFTTFSKELPLDGEILFGKGYAVAAKEWCNATQQEDGFRVLTKHGTGVALMRKDALVALLERSSCMPL